MTELKLNKLSNELRQAGAKKTEVGPLLGLARQLRQLPDTGAKTGLSPTALPRFPSRLVLAGCSALVGLVVGGILITLAQTSLPGGWLYPVKQLSEQTAVLLHPDHT